MGLFSRLTKPKKAKLDLSNYEIVCDGYRNLQLYHNDPTGFRPPLEVAHEFYSDEIVHRRIYKSFKGAINLLKAEAVRDYRRRVAEQFTVEGWK